MSKKQWYGVIGLFLGLAVLVFSLVFFTEKKEKDRDVVGEAQEETKKERDKVKDSVGEMLGTKEPMITWSEMKILVETYEEEAKEKGEELYSVDISEKIEEEYGIFNALAYDMDLVIDDKGEEFVNKQMLNDLLFYYYSTHSPTKEEFKNIKILGTSNVVDYENSVGDSTKENKKSPALVIEKSEVLGDIYLLASDTEGFHKENKMRVGYPVVNTGTPYGEMVTKDGIDEVTDMTFEVSYYLEEDITLGKFLDQLEKTEVTVGKHKADLKGERHHKKEATEYFLRNTELLEGNMDEKAIEKYMEVDSRYEPIDYILIGPRVVFLNDIDKSADIYGDWELTTGDVKEYEKFLKKVEKDKLLLGDTIVRVQYDIDKEAFIGKESVYEDPFKYYEEGHKPPVITVDGVDMQLHVVDDKMIGNGIYYKQ